MTSLDPTGALLTAVGVEREVPPLFVSLGANAALPSEEYVRVIALSGPHDLNIIPPSLQNGVRNGNGRQNSISGGASMTNINVKNRSSGGGGGGSSSSNWASVSHPKDSVVRHDFALHARGARMCRLLETMLDTADLQLDVHSYDSNACGSLNKADRKGKDSAGDLPPVVLPQATRRGCEVLFQFLDLMMTRIPTTLSKPLRAPIEELVQPWELKFLLNNCMDETISRAITQQMSVEQEGGNKKNNTNAEGKASYYRVILNGAPQSLNLLLEVAMLSDFLLVEPLRQLTCAFIASLALNASSDAELLRLCGLQRAMTEEELDPLYAQFAFLRPDNGSDW
ncbi:hypothetical protein DQ04_00241010 [Trypanosoma grayi]|uniref:hypothetical protein n=1 Tax=Trypanosoma grayi TaxID=71804 RepID=UPI0004F4AF7B|nr:hypothetical protein DQ04_00241010 [Trypanosoma grayi]KEG14959.1 hypothetical protein DQ04_00241010 [Trypanosoma grayi]